ncbi:MAG: LptF/LptG family permease [Sedimentisphaerales bacterium]|nr:LptF/LptG family permease [Sedimentisphaerales bacterium]
MVFILQRYIFRELFKVLILATIALTLIMSLGIILRPIQEYGVGPRQVFHLLGYFIPITLTFVLPLSGLFAAALVYGRFANDNELDACRASGVSLLTLIYPGLALAIVIAIANLVLSFHVVPIFFHRAERELKADAKQILFRNIQRRGFYSLPFRGKDRRIYADKADSTNDILEGVIVTEIQGGRIQKIITAQSASVRFHLQERINEVQIVANHIYRIGDEEEGWFYSERFPIRAEFTSMLADDIKFKKIEELKRIYNNPLLFYPVEEKARESFAQYTSELLCEDIKSGIAEVNDFYELRGEPNSVRFTASDLGVNTKRKTDDAQVKLSGNVLVQQFDMDTGNVNKTWSCSEALLKIEGDEFHPTLTMELFNPHWAEPGGSEGIAAGRQYIRGLLLPKQVSDKLDTENVLDTINPQAVSSSLAAGPSEKLVGLLNSLKITISKVFVKITAELHTRLVFGVGCVPLIMIGIGLGIILRGGHLLSAFGASAIPAGLLVVCIMMGKNFAKNPGGGLTAGVLMMWGGFAVLVCLAAGLLYKLLKN